MSSITWTPTGLESSSSHLTDEVWRCIPSDTVRPLIKILNNHEDVEILERMLKESKPVLQVGFEKYDRLIYGPFQYSAQVVLDSRFRQKGGPGVLYSAFDIKTALFEHSWHRARFIAKSEGLQNIKAMPLQVFKLAVDLKIIDLSSGKFKKDKSKWLSKNDYTQTQSLAKLVHKSTVQGIKYESVRNVDGGFCLAIFYINGIKSTEPIFHDGNWWLSFTGNVANVQHDRLVGSGMAYSFSFTVDD